MPKRGENIYKRKDHRWEGRYIKEKHATGRIHYGYVYGHSYREVKRKLAEARADWERRSALACSQEGTLDAYCKAWLDRIENQVKESTYVKYRNMATCHIRPVLGSLPLSHLNDSILEAFSSHLLTEGALKKKGGLSPKTVRDILTLLHAVLQYAQAENGGGPIPRVRYPREQKTQPRVLSREEQERLIRYLRAEADHCKRGVLLSLLTGMRIGEICALRWQDISLEERTVRIRYTMQRIQHVDEKEKTRTRILVSAPKTFTSNRIIPLTDHAMDLCRSAGQPDPDAFVLTGTAEHFMEPRTLQYRMAKYMRECGLEQVHFHTLRHTFATRCVEVGFEIKSLSEILGHSSVKVTLDRYVHSSLQLKRDNMDKLAAIGL